MSGFIFLVDLSQRIWNDQRNCLRVLRRTLRDEQDPFQITTDEHFMELYRMPKSLCLNLINELLSFLPKSQRKHSIPHHLIVLSAIRFFGTGSFQKSVGQDNLSSMSQTSVSRCVQVVATALNNISGKYIKFPKREEFPAKKVKFMEKHNFPGIIGLIDGTHVKISAPKKEVEHVYYCQKGGHSKNVMIVCDADYIILAANAQFGGTAHDSFVWRRSRACRALEELYGEGERNFWLLGDSGYLFQPWLMTPISAPTSVPEERFNIAHKSTRVLVERCIGILKSRFRCLSKERALFYSPKKAGLIINACMVLHNYLMMKKVPFEEIYLENPEEFDGDEDVILSLDNSNSNTMSIAKRQRSKIV